MRTRIGAFIICYGHEPRPRKVVDLFAEGNMVVEIGSWNTTYGDGKPKDNGHYMSFFQKRDGKYVCVRDMNVSSNPATK